MLTVRATTPDDLPALAELYAEGFGRPLPAAEWHWKYAALPGAARSLVACDPGGELLAHVGAYALPTRWHGGEGLAWQLADFVGRRRGLRPPLVVAGRALLRDLPRPGDVPWIFGFPSGRHLALGERVFGYRWLPPIVPWEGDLPAATAGAAAVPAIGDRAPEWAERCWEECGVDGVRRSAAFLDWRYHARPERYYRFYALAAGDRRGLAVAAFVAGCAAIAELWLPPGPDWSPALLGVAGDLRATGFARWRFWPQPAGQELLERLGARPQGEPVPCGCCSGGAGSERAAELAAGLYYAMGDHDAV
jgi:hypothetical protein